MERLLKILAHLGEENNLVGVLMLASTYPASVKRKKANRFGDILVLCQ